MILNNATSNSQKSKLTFLNKQDWSPLVPKMEKIEKGIKIEIPQMRNETNFSQS